MFGNSFNGSEGRMGLYLYKSSIADMWNKNVQSPISTTTNSKVRINSTKEN